MLVVQTKLMFAIKFRARFALDVLPAYAVNASETSRTQYPIQKAQITGPVYLLTMPKTLPKNQRKLSGSGLRCLFLDLGAN